MAGPGAPRGGLTTQGEPGPRKRRDPGRPPRQHRDSSRRCTISPSTSVGRDHGHHEAGTPAGGGSRPYRRCVVRRKPDVTASVTRTIDQVPAFVCLTNRIRARRRRPADKDEGQASRSPAGCPPQEALRAGETGPVGLRVADQPEHREAEQRGQPKPWPATRSWRRCRAGAGHAAARAGPGSRCPARPDGALTAPPAGSVSRPRWRAGSAPAAPTPARRRTARTGGRRSSDGGHVHAALGQPLLDHRGHVHERLDGDPHDPLPEQPAQRLR